MKEKKYVTYRRNQYEDINHTNIPKDRIEAKYIKQELPEYAGNILIEVLPPTRDVATAYKDMRRIPVYSEKERFKDALYRMQAIMRLRGFVCVQVENVVFDQCFDRVTRNALVYKRIDTTEYKKAIKHTARELRESKNVNR